MVFARAEQTVTLGVITRKHYIIPTASVGYTVIINGRKITADTLEEAKFRIELHLLRNYFAEFEIIDDD
jgi:hypothetical protein